MDLRQAVCIVTGSSSGVGAATARLMASRGARVVINYARSAEAAEAVAASCRELVTPWSARPMSVKMRIAAGWLPKRWLSGVGLMRWLTMLAQQSLLLMATLRGLMKQIFTIFMGSTSLGHFKWCVRRERL